MAEQAPRGIRVLFFGSLSERLGIRERTAAHAVTVNALWQAVAGGVPRQGVRPARNLRFCEWETSLADGDEVAFMPPVSGG